MAKSQPRNYGTQFNPFGDYSGAVVQRDGKYFTSSGWGQTGKKLKPDTSPFSDFERNWYMERGFGDPTKLVAKYYDSSGKLIQDPTRYAYRTPIIKGQGGNVAYMDLTNRSPLGFGMAPYGVTTKYEFQGVSPEARQMYLMATGGVDPIKATTGDLMGPERTVVEGKQGIGTIQSITQARPAPVLEDPNQGRNILRIRRA